MKIKIPRQDLLDTVNRVKSVVLTKSALPILSHILIETADDSIKLVATDLKVSIECTVDCTIEEAGALTVSSQRISSMLAELPDEDITLHLVDKNVIELTCGRVEMRLFSMSPEEFPPVRTFQGIEALLFPQSLLRKMFLKSSFAICSDQARYNLTGLLFELRGGCITVVATDGRRMSISCEKEGIPKTKDIKVIIPAKMVYELGRLLGDETDTQVYIDESQAAFVFNETRLVTALIEGSFPNYEMVVPKKYDKEAVIYTVKFMEAMRRTRTMTNDKFNSVRVGISSGVMSLKVVTPEVGEYEEEVAIEYEGESVDIAFNPDFVLDVLRRIDTEKVALILKDAMSPGVIKPYTDIPLENFINVVMPIRV